MKSVFLTVLLAAVAASANPVAPKVSAQVVGQLANRLQELQANNFDGAQWQAMPPVGANYARVALVRKPCCDQYDYTALLPYVTVTMNPVAVDPNGSFDFFVERSGGKTGKPAWAGPFSVWSKAALQAFVAKNEAALKAVPGVRSVSATCVLNGNRCYEVLWVAPADGVSLPDLKVIAAEIVKRFPELRNARVAVTAALPA